MHANWLNPSDIYIVQPQSREEAESLADDLAFIIAFLPDVDQDILEWCFEHPKVITLVYAGDQPAGFIRIDSKDDDDELGRSTASLHGVIRPEFEHLGIVQQAVPAVLENLFRTTDKKKVLAKIPADNKPAQHCVVDLGFERLNEEDGMIVYRLMKKDFLNSVGR